MSLWTWFLLLFKLLMAAFALEDYCRQGTYGNNCELKCPDQCRPLQIFPCDKITGQCSEGCNSGYFGDQCDKKCSCPTGICYQKTGDCFGTVPATSTATFNMTNKVSYTTAGVAAGWRTTAIILIVFNIFLACGGVMMFLYVRFKKMKITLTDTWKIIFSKAAHVSGDEEERTQPVSKMKEGKALLRGSKGQFEASQPLGEQYLCCFCPREIKRMRFCINQRLKPRSKERRDIDISLKSDQAEKKPQTYKGSTEVEELRQENQRLTVEDKENQRLLVSMPEEGKALSPKEPDIEAAGGQCEVTESLGDQAGEKPPMVKRSTEGKELRQENQRLKDEDKKNQRLLGPNLRFDKETVNVKVAQIDGNMVLWNTPDTGNRGNNVKRFKKFHGTTCTEPLVKSQFNKYFEAFFDIDLKQPIEEGEVVMQLGFCKEKDRDKTPFIEIKKKCFLVEIANCNIHNKICLVSTNNGKTKHLKEVMINGIGTKERVMIGIRVDKDMKKIKLYDGLKLNVLQETEITIGEKIWPMFGVCDERSASVSVQLKVGDDISKEKKENLKSEHM